MKIHTGETHTNPDLLCKLWHCYSNRAAGSIIYFGLMFLLFVAFFLCCLTTSPSLCRKRWVSTLNYKPQFSLTRSLYPCLLRKQKQHCVAVLIKNNSDWTTCVAECCFSGTSKFLTSCCLVSICHVTPAFVMLLSLPFEGGAQLLSANFYLMHASHCAGSISRYHLKHVR